MELVPEFWNSSQGNAVSLARILDAGIGVLISAAHPPRPAWPLIQPIRSLFTASSNCYSSCVITLRKDLHNAVMILADNFHPELFFLPVSFFFFGLFFKYALYFCVGNSMYIQPCWGICRRTILRAHPGRGSLTFLACSLT